MVSSGNDNFGRAQVAAMLKEDDKKKDNEETMTSSMTSEAKTLISALTLYQVEMPAKCLKAASTNVSRSNTNSESEVSAERCALALMEKFSKLSTNAKCGKSVQVVANAPHRYWS